MAARGQFSTRIGFILAAAGSAIGLGNVWGFPTNVASNGGAAFVLVYLILAFLLAYPVLMVELLVGRHYQSNPVNAYRKLTGNIIGAIVGVIGLLTVSFILSFYAIVGGWIVTWCLHYFAMALGMTEAANWLVTFGNMRNVIFTVIFFVLTAAIVRNGVSEGIEKWSTRLMPLFFLIIILLIIYVATLDGAGEGFRAYLTPDFSIITDPELIINAMGQAFFSLSLAVGTMLVYGSYISKKENIVSLGIWVAVLDISIAIVAGLLIIPAMYVAQANGVQIYDEAGALISSDGLLFSVLPSLFETMTSTAIIVPIAFFTLMIIAAVTSSISMLEVPVSFAIENHNLTRNKATFLIAGSILLISLIIVFNFGSLFGLVITATTEWSQPLLGLVISIFAGWLWHRNNILEEIKEGNPDAANGLFFKIWPWYIKFVCPALIALMFWRSL